MKTKNRINFDALTKRLAFKSVGTRLAFTRTPADPAKGVKEPTNTLSGYAIVWNELSDDRGCYKVKLAPGSALFATPCFALHNHDFNQVIGNTANKTLRIMPDTYGVKVEIDLPDTTVGNDVAELVEDGYVAGMSFSMAKGFEKYQTDETDDTTVITVQQFTCDEVTVTAIPAFTGTSIDLVTPEEPPAPPAADDTDDTDARKESARLDRLRLDFAKL